MSFIAIVGGGALGGALAHKLAARGNVPEVRLIDPEGAVARGKALDILQSAPIEGFSTRVSAADSLAAAAGAEVIVIADSPGQGEHRGDTGLGLLRELVRLDTTAPIVCAGALHRELIARAVSELHIPAARILGSAPLALESAVRALAGLMLDSSGVEVSLRILGVPPGGAVVAWEEGAAFGQPLTTQLRPHEIAALSARIPGLWPPGAYALSSAAARIVEAIAAGGSRRRYSCFVAVRRTAAAMPVELGPEGVRAVLQPTLTRQEQTALDNALGDGPGTRRN
jgi:malate dehydrogenase